MRCCDMIVNLQNIQEQKPADAQIRIKRVFPGDKDAVLSFIKTNFSNGWACEAEHAIAQSTPKCFIATRNGQILGFACFDASALGFFGPIGVLAEERGHNLGAALLFHTLDAMRHYGYGYAVIGWVGEAEQFYRKIAGAEFISGGYPENSVYTNMISMN